MSPNPPTSRTPRPDRRRWWWLPAAFGWVPLMGWPLLGDQLLSGWERPAAYGPLSSFAGTLGETGRWLHLGGNFRPFGRVLFDWAETVRWPLADLVGVPAYAVQGVERVAAAAVVAAAACAVANRLRTDAGYPPRQVGLMPVVLAACLVAAWPAHPTYTYPLFQVGLVAAWAVAAPLVVTGSHHDAWTPQRWEWRDRRLWAAAALGVLAAVTYELLYATPVVVAVYTAVRGRLISVPALKLAHTAAFRRAVAYAAGTAAVAVPARILIEARSVVWRYAGTDIVDTVPTVAQAADVWLWRAVVGNPAAGWLLTLWSEAARLWPVIAAVAVTAVAFAWLHRPTAAPRGVAVRAVWAQIVFGAAVIAAAAAVAAASAEMWEQHNTMFLPAWRDTAVVQIGWAFIIAAAFDHLTAGRRLLRTRQATAIVVAAAMMTATVTTHVAVTAVIRQNPLPAASAAVDSLSVVYQPDADHTRLRCAASQALRNALEDRPAQGDAERTLAAVDDVIRRRHGPGHSWCPQGGADMTPGPHPYAATTSPPP